MSVRLNLISLVSLIGVVGLSGLGPVGGGAAFAQGADKVAASVNGKPILFTDYVIRLQRLRAQDFIVSTNPLQVRSATAGVLTLDALINELVILEWGAKTNDVPSDAEVEKTVAEQKALPNIAAQIAAGGLTDNEIRYEARVQLTRFNIATAAVTVTPSDLENYYKMYPERFTTPERWGISVIRTGTAAKANEAAADLKKGLPFAMVAKSKSDDPATREKDGSLGMVASNDASLPAAAKTAITKLKVGDVTPVTPIELNDPRTGMKVTFYFIFRLTAKDPGVKRSFADAQSQLRRALLLEKAGGYTEADKKLADFRKTAKVEILLPGFAELKAPAAPTPAPGN